MWCHGSFRWGYFSRNIILAASIILATAGQARAADTATTATPIRYLPYVKAWILNTNQASYVIGLNERNELQNVHWGEKLKSDHDVAPAHSMDEHASFDSSETMTNIEYPGWGGRYYNEPSLKVTLDDGTRDLVLRYDSHEIRGDTLEIRLKDIRYALFVTLRYKVFPKVNIIRKQAEIENRTAQAMTIESAQSGVWYVPEGERYRLTYLTGRWVGETQVVQEPINPGTKVLESRRGNTSHNLNPWYAIDGEATEEQGRVWFGALGWSGNWKMTIEQSSDRQVTVVGGYNDFDSATCSSPANRSTRRRSMADTRVRASARLRASCTASCAGSFCPTARIRTRAPCFTTRGKRRRSP